MRKALELASVLGPDKIEEALGLAAIAGRFDDGDLVSILDHLATSGKPTDVVFADENHTIQPGTGPWDSAREAFEQAAVSGREDFPGFEVNDSAFDQCAPRVEAAVELPLRYGQLPVGTSAESCQCLRSVHFLGIRRKVEGVAGRTVSDADDRLIITAPCQPAEIGRAHV